MFGDLDQPLGQIEHLSLLHPRLHRPGQDAEAAATDARRVPLDPVRRLDPLERVALVPSLPAARLARLPAKAPGNARLLLQPVARRRLRAVGAVLSQLPSKLSDLRPQCGVLGPQRFVLAPQFGELSPKRLDQLANFDSTTHPYLDSHHPSSCRGDALRNPNFSPNLWQFGLTPPWELQSCMKEQLSRCNLSAA